MSQDIVALRAFYDTLLGHVAEGTIAHALNDVWPKLPDERLVGLGYALPFLDRLQEGTERTFAFMPARQGAVRWPAEGESRSALIFDEELPLPDSSVDRFLLVHALEHAEAPGETLKEIWRVLAPNGRLVIVVPNRRGVWARFEHTPFGTGRPFSGTQLNALLREANFSTGASSAALFFPPSRRRWMLRFHRLFERFGRAVWPIFAGVLVVEAQKKLYQGVPVARRASRRVFVPVLSPQGAARLSHEAVKGSET
ncbi:class I SAM-dependent methyltransferase [Mesorhizobium sp. RP14(2022)]|uniref:Class I SAM-dependent methyltransferase n=1 Tax=Mesorhizobium liriopis TaxID=2953882 RepID=A0ABT1CBV5_9HYPH|nr:methyltransferase domain-containing protein [Mesorhizobium liriopis]MCO6051661.1 class I SAM-dependent methyltransferase [Mesorhizobium liriopis]